MPIRWQRPLPSWLPPAILGMSLVAMLWWTWDTWPDAQIDFGRELYVAWQLSVGKVLYVDVTSFNGPLSSYVNAFWFRLLGVSLRSLVVGNLVLLALLLSLLYRICREISDTLSATVACLVFVGVFAVGEYLDVGNYNYVTPYSHELTHGVVLSLVGIYALLHYARSGSVEAAAGIGLALGLTALTKSEVFLAASVAFVPGFALATLVVRKAGCRLAPTAVALAACGMPVVAAFALLRAAMPADQAVASLVAPWSNVFSRDLLSLSFYTRITGVDRPLHMLLAMGVATAVYLLVFGGAGIAAHGFRGSKPGAFGPEIAAVTGWAVLALEIVLPRSVVDSVGRPLPLAMVVAAIALAGALVRDWHDRERARLTVVRLTVVIFSLALLAKMLLNTRLYHYGFVLAMPATLVLVVSLVGWIPNWLATTEAAGRSFRATALTVVAVVVILFMGIHKDRLAQHVYPIGEGGDRFVADARAISAKRAIDEIRRRVQPHERLVVVPEGVMLNYMARRASSSPYPSFLPPEFVLFGGDRLLASLVRDPPEFIALVDRPTEEYGLPVFGRDYGRDMSAWVAARYQEVVAIPASPLQAGRYGIRLLRRAAP